MNWKCNKKKQIDVTKMINPVNTYQTREGIFFYNYSCQVFQAVSGEILI